MHTALIILATPIALAGCSKSKDVTVSNAWLRLAPIPSRPAAAYFTIHGGATDKTLIDVSSAFALRAEMHETMSSGEMSEMKPLRQLSVPARAEIKFAPGGRHVMLFGLSPRITPGTRVSLTLTFGDGTRLETFAKAIAAGDPAP